MRKIVFLLLFFASTGCVTRVLQPPILASILDSVHKKPLAEVEVRFWSDGKYHVVSRTGPRGIFKLAPVLYKEWNMIGGEYTEYVGPTLEELLHEPQRYIVSVLVDIKAMVIETERPDQQGSNESDENWKGAYKAVAELIRNTSRTSAMAGKHSKPGFARKKQAGRIGFLITIVSSWLNFADKSEERLRRCLQNYKP